MFVQDGFLYLIVTRQKLTVPFLEISMQFGRFFQFICIGLNFLPGGLMIWPEICRVRPALWRTDEQHRTSAQSQSAPKEIEAEWRKGLLLYTVYFKHYLIYMSSILYCTVYTEDLDPIHYKQAHLHPEHTTHSPASISWYEHTENEIKISYLWVIFLWIALCLGGRWSAHERSLNHSCKSFKKGFLSTKYIIFDAAYLKGTASVDLPIHCVDENVKLI